MNPAPRKDLRKRDWSKRMRKADSTSALVKAESQPKKDSRNKNAKADARRRSREFAKPCLPIPSREPQPAASWSNLDIVDANSVIEGRTSEQCLRTPCRDMKSALGERTWNGRGKSTSEAMRTDPLQELDTMDASKQA